MEKRAIIDKDITPSEDGSQPKQHDSEKTAEVGKEPYRVANIEPEELEKLEEGHPFRRMIDSMVKRR